MGDRSSGEVADESTADKSDSFTYFGAGRRANQQNHGIG
jgi:hypothetical protein